MFIYDFPHTMVLLKCNPIVSRGAPVCLCVCVGFKQYYCVSAAKEPNCIPDRDSRG